MKNACNILYLVILFSVGVLLLSSFNNTESKPTQKGLFPYRKAGLTERQAAAHLLNRFTNGPKPGQVDQVVQIGLEKWFLQQLQAELPDPDLNRQLAAYPSLQMDNQQILQTYPKNGQILKMAIQEGVIQKDEVKKDGADKKDYRKALEGYMEQKGYRPQRELVQELVSQKIIRSAYSQNQLQEVLTSFWFNHFNVSFTDNDCTPFITTYERDVIRPHALGKFEEILLATAQSPAMLAYLDNYKSSAPLNPSSANGAFRPKVNATGKIKKVNTTGLNENYAREVMELHTMGVDGGYTQQDVTQAARVLTGWTFFNNYQPAKVMANAPTPNNINRSGQLQVGKFYFAARRHDTGEKIVLGTKFPAGGGYEEGVKLLQMLARHPATARFISTKLAVRFVRDNPSKTLVDRMAKTFQQQNGDIRQVLLTMVQAPEFWQKEALREKTKSPFELAISSVRSLDAEIKAPYQLYTWITRMGEKMYYYQAPTGFPDKGQYWINTGSLLNRMNFGLALASGHIPGVKLNLAALNQNREPESAEAALFTYSKYLLPERDLQETIKRLTPSLHDPEFIKKVETAADQATGQQPGATSMPADSMMAPQMTIRQKVNNRPGKKQATMEMQLSNGTNTMLAQVVGIIIGSPEFQRK